MPRTPRQLSATNIYHVMLRGINKQDIFLEDEDRTKFLSSLRECKTLCGFELYAYCLMDNHVHLLLKTGAEPMSTIFRRLAGRFVYWYNLKYQRTGHLFQDRFRSEPVEDDAYFLTVLRYIHQNPMAAGLERKPGSYRWSSYFSYAGWPDGLTDTKFAVSLFPDRDALLAYLREVNDDQVMDVRDTPRAGMTDEAAREILAEVSGCRDADAFRDLGRSKQIACLDALIRRRLSLRQIARLTGISVPTIRRVLEQ